MRSVRGETGAPSRRAGREVRLGHRASLEQDRHPGGPGSDPGAASRTLFPVARDEEVDRAFASELRAGRGAGPGAARRGVQRSGFQGIRPGGSRNPRRPGGLAVRHPEPGTRGFRGAGEGAEGRRSRRPRPAARGEGPGPGPPGRPGLVCPAPGGEGAGDPAVREGGASPFEAAGGRQLAGEERLGDGGRPDERRCDRNLPRHPRGHRLIDDLGSPGGETYEKSREILRIMVYLGYGTPLLEYLKSGADEGIRKELTLILQKGMAS